MFVGGKVVFVGGKVVFVSVVVGLVASVVVVFDWASEPREKIQGNLYIVIKNDFEIFIGCLNSL